MALVKCSECGSDISDKSKTCPHCGHENSVWICPECRGEVGKWVNTCPNCGYKKGLLSKGKEKNNMIIYPVVIIGLIVLIKLFKSMGGVNLEDVFNAVGCDNYYCDLADDGSYLSVDTNPLDLDDYSSSTAIKYVKNINSELGFSDALYTKMGKTRALDGTQTDENSKVKVSWTYHPDKGLSVVYYKK